MRQPRLFGRVASGIVEESFRCSSWMSCRHGCCSHKVDYSRNRPSGGGGHKTERQSHRPQHLPAGAPLPPFSLSFPSFSLSLVSPVSLVSFASPPTHPLQLLPWLGPAGVRLGVVCLRDIDLHLPLWQCSHPMAYLLGMLSRDACMPRDHSSSQIGIPSAKLLQKFPISSAIALSTFGNKFVVNSPRLLA